MHGMKQAFAFLARVVDGLARGTGVGRVRRAGRGIGPNTRMAIVALASVCAWPLLARAGEAPAARVHPWGHPGCPCSGTLRPGAPDEAGLEPGPLQAMDGTLSRILVRRVAPGAVVLVARRGIIAKWQAYGYAALYTNADFDPMSDPVPMRKDTIFDLASVTKLFTATAIMQLWDRGKLKLDDPVAKYLPGFAANGKGAVTIRELLTHTSGFRPDPPVPLYKIAGTRQQRIDDVLRQPLEYPPGTHYVYSDMNFITLGALVEKLSGEREDRYIRRNITAPLHMQDTLYDPPASLKSRIAATEYQPWTQRGLLWGQVDDENAWALGGVAGHAGLFSDAHDLAVFGQMMLNKGVYDGKRILSERAVKLIETDWDARFQGNAGGLGWAIDRGYFMGALSGPHTLGHEGYTGTTLVIDTSNDTVAVLLMNRLHPTRNGASDVVARREVYTDVAAAVPVAAPGAGGVWFSGYGDYLNRALVAKIGGKGADTLSFQTWYRTDAGNDYGIVSASPDGKRWTELTRLTGASAGWQQNTVKLPAGTRYLQFDYRTDAAINGRGWYLHDVRVDGRSIDSGFEQPTDWSWQAR